MIPKIIHYCWFGKKKKPKKVLEYIKSWKDLLPDYTIKEWNESNFDVQKWVFTKEAYKLGKFAFVSDVARLKALHDEGGVYFDTDVRVVKRFDEFMHENCFMSWENKETIGTAVIGAEKENPLIASFLAMYDDKHFLKEDGSKDETPNTILIMNIIKTYGAYRPNTITKFEGICSIYPKDYFSVKEIETGKYYLTSNTRCIHDFSCTWTSWYWRLYMVFKRKINVLLNRNFQS